MGGPRKIAAATLLLVFVGAAFTSDAATSLTTSLAGYRAARVGPPAVPCDPTTPACNTPLGCLVAIADVRAEDPDECQVHLWVTISGRGTAGSRVTTTVTLWGDNCDWTNSQPLGVCFDGVPYRRRAATIVSRKGTWRVTVGPYKFPAAGLGPDCDGFGVDAASVAGRSRAAFTGKFIRPCV
jgi:hypothetical protein